MKVLVLGTSNSIMKEGWLTQVTPFASRAGIRFDNQSVGGSPSLYLAYRLHDLNILNGTDRVIVDFCVNDQMFIDKGTFDVDRVEGHYFAAFRQLSQRSMLSRTLVLLFPQQRYVEEAVECPLIERLKVLCGLFGVDWLDAGEVVLQTAKRRGESVAAGYSDPRHFAPDYQREIGLAALRLLRKQRLVGPRAWLNRRVLRKIPARCFKPLTVECENHIPSEVLGTSLAKYLVRRMPNKARAKVSGAKYVWGMFHWTHDNAGAFCLRGLEKEHRYHLRRVWTDLFLFDAFQSPLEIERNAILRVENDKTVPFELLQTQISSIYPCEGSTVDLVALVGSDLSPDHLTDLVLACQGQCSAGLWQRIRFGLVARLTSALRI